MALITVENLSYGYDDQTIVEDLNFTVNQGDYLCIVGENGSGKTTLLKCLLRFREPLGGRILFGDGLKRNEIGYLPQQSSLQRDFPASVMEVVLSGCQGRLGWRPFYNQKEKRMAEENMRKMGVLEYRNRSHRALSGGQQQRVFLARALCATGKLLLLDEPVSGLDPRGTEEMYRRIEELNREGISIVMISHDVTAAVRYASHILHIDRTTFFGTRSEYMKSKWGAYLK